jgi:uncharacterized membrane protein
VHVLIVVVALGVTILWRTYSPFLVYAIEGTNPSAQLAEIMHHPVTFAISVANTLLSQTKLYIMSTIGILGWMMIGLPKIMYVIPVISVLICILLLPRSEGVQIGALEASWHIFLLGVSGLLIYVALYLYATPVGFGMVIAIQGRYFLPLAGLAAVTLSATISPLSRHGAIPALAVLCLTSAEVLLTLGVVSRAYKVLCIQC